jgi:hypothetical protein
MYVPLPSYWFRDIKAIGCNVYTLRMELYELMCEVAHINTIPYQCKKKTIKRTSKMGIRCELAFRLLFHQRCTVNSTSNYTLWTLYRSYSKGIRANIEPQVYSVGCVC